MPIRASFLVDGFNLYHSLKEIHGVTKASVKWLDVKALCTTYLQAVRKPIGERVELSRVHYFSARPDFLAHRKPDTVARYDTYMKALRESGVVVNISQFKRKDTYCPHCKASFGRHEEKETDVALAMKMVEVLVKQECETVVVVTGDTDLIPAIRAVQGLLPRNKIGVAFPFRRHNNELESVADYSFNIGQRDVQRCQFPREVRVSDGSLIKKPSTW